MIDEENNINTGGAVAHNASQSQTTKYGCGKNGCTGHGLSAEDANAIADQLKGNKVIKVGTKNIKDGADRISNGIEIQTKYCKSARDTVNSAFHNGEFRYIDKNGQPMKIEVPKDQYTEALQIMRTKISEGKVNGVTNPDDATKIIKKGIVTYLQAVKITKAGTVESLIYDVATGTVSSVAGAGISATIAFVSMKKNGATTKEALIGAGKQGGTTFTTTIATQVAVGQIEKLIVRKASQKAAQTVTNTVVKEMPKYTKVLSHVAKSSMRTNAVTAAVTTVITTLPDINKARKKEISWKECGERATTNAASVVAGIATSAVAVAAITNPVVAIGVSVVAGMGGSMAGGKLAKAGGKLVKKGLTLFKKKKK